MQPHKAPIEAVEDELALFFALSLDFLCVAGLDGYFKRLNPAWSTGLGWDVKELQARPFIEYVHPDDRASTLAEINTLSAGIETVMFENRYRHKDGRYRWLRWNARPDPERQLIYATARDVTGQKRLEKEILEIADREKERLGRELHDGLCQTLAGVSALSSTLANSLMANSQPGESSIAIEIVKLLNEAIGDARGLARGLHPVGLNERGLDAALEALAENVRHKFRVSCIFERGGSSARLCPDTEVHLYRIAQEAVNNAVSHGRGDRIEIGLSLEGRQCILSVNDNGVGLSGDTSNADGMGLHTTAYRARLIGGLLEVRPRTPRGTAVVCSFPVADTPDSGESPDHALNDI
jgi:PAS domain S-box-containing protein